MSRRPECQGRSGSRNRKVAGSLVVICLLAFAGPLAVAQSDERPWELPGDERELARQYRAPNYWFERYLRAYAIMAKQINEGGKGDPGELDKAIALLRLAIVKRASASAVEPPVPEWSAIASSHTASATVAADGAEAPANASAVDPPVPE